MLNIINTPEDKLRDSTLMFLIKKDSEKITDICLAMKKRGFGMNRWNGSGGKVEPGENINEATIRETREEIGVEIKEMNKIAELLFYFPHNTAWNQKVHVYFSEKWEGEPSESEEMKPQWFSVDNIPYSSMWPDDILWLPKVLNGELIKAGFVFGEGDVINESDVSVVDML